MRRRAGGQSRWAQSRPLAPVDSHPAAASESPPPAPPGGDRSPAVPPTRTARTWTALTVGTVGLIVVLVFILQNLKSVRVSFFFVHWKLPLALDLLLAAVLGGAVVLTAGSLRILQLRRTARRHHLGGGDGRR